MRILIVDVDGSAGATVEVLRKDGHEIVVCESGDEALRMLEERRADLVLVGRPDNVVKFRSGNRTNVGVDENRGTGGVANVIPLHHPTGSTGTPGALPDLTPFIGSWGLTDILENIEGRLVAVAMDRSGHNQIRAAELLRITRGALQYKLKKYIKPEAA